MIKESKACRLKKAYEFSTREIAKVIKRGNEWCIVHCHGADAGKLIPGSCHTSKEETLKMHRAIMFSKGESSAFQQMVKVGDVLYESGGYSVVILSNGSSAIIKSDLVKGEFDLNSVPERYPYTGIPKDVVEKLYEYREGNR